MAFERALVDLDPNNRTRKQLSDFGASVLLNAAGVTTPIQEDEESIEASTTCHFLESMKESLARKEASKGITSNQDFLLSELSDENVLYLAHESLLKNPNFMQQAAQKNIKSLRFANSMLFDNHTFREEYLFAPGTSIAYPELVANLPKNLKEDDRLINTLSLLTPLNKKCKLLHNLSPTFRNDLKFVSKIQTKIGSYEIPNFIAATGKDLKNNPKFVQPLLDQCPDNKIPELVAALGENLKNDSGFMNQALARCEKSRLENFVDAIGSELKASKIFMLELINQYAPKDNDLTSQLHLLNNTLKADLEFVSDLISRATELNPILTLQNILKANPSANDDAGIMGHLLKHCNQTNIVGFTKQLGPTLQNNPEFVTKLLEKTYMYDIDKVVPLLGTELKNNADFMRSALAIYSDYNVHSFIEVLGDDLKSNKAFIREALAKCKRSELDNFQEAMGDAGYKELQNDIRARRGGRSFFSAYRFFT